MSEILPAPVDVPVEADVALPPPSLPPRPRLRATHAWLAFAMLFGVQFVSGIVFFIFLMTLAAMSGENLLERGGMEKVMARSQAEFLLVAAVMSAAAVLLSVRIWGSHLLRDRTPDGLGLFVPPARQTLMWGLAGGAFAMGYLLVCSSLLPADPSMPLGPLAAAAKAGGAARLAFAVVALLIAPPIEELLYRGLMLRGFAASWGMRASATVVTILFVLMHLAETFRYWPATIAILVLAITTALARIRTGSLVPPLAVHFAWNAAIVIAIYVL